MEAAARSRAVVETGERNALEDLFTQDIRFYSPVKVAPFKGKQVVPHRRRRRHRRTPARPAALRRQPSAS
ncbi:hypothetical protein [Streptomyces sp. NBC_00199]|uniref:hypothetical protein n=1 Tax=Streptomyces sp. NBC_00199 TaxID=2975678 RepID=UPI0022519DB9|nr:hypothetical protein [Streptomyces sp. NBC_00199]MCX5267654.1 hypothetical protein [Streptomyces sp. NBC_00199]